MPNLIPATVVPIRYAATYADSSTAIDLGTDRVAVMAWIRERTFGWTRESSSNATVAPLSWEATATYARDAVERAESEGSAYVFEWDVPAVVEAWQRPVTQGEADALEAWELARFEAAATERVHAEGKADAAEQAALLDDVDRDAPSTGELEAWQADAGNRRAEALVQAARAASAGIADPAEAEAAWGDAWEAAQGVPLTDATITEAAEGIVGALDVLRRKLATDQAPDARSTDEGPDAAELPPLAAGQSVRIILAGPYYGRTGAVVIAGNALMVHMDDGQAIAGLIRADLEAVAQPGAQRRPGSTGKRSPLASRAAELSASPFPLGSL